MRNSIPFAWLTLVTLTISLAHQSLFGQDAPTLAPGFVQEQLVSGLNPSTMALAPDGRLFIVEKGGQIRIYRDGRLLPDPFIELEVDDTNERGLSGLSFHPDFERNGYVYVYYTVPLRGFNRISRLRANGDFAVPGSEEVIFDLDELSGSSIHNGGAMVWLPDTTLLVAVGDGGISDRAQQQNTTLGKFLRLHSDGSIPADNPFASTTEGKARAIYASGIRNSFTMAVQASSGRVFANDVGGSAWEEVNEVLAGANYGWPLVEGSNGVEQAPPNYVAPIHQYSHDDGCAIVGAAFYEPLSSTFPAAYLNKYLFGDYCRGDIRVLDPISYELATPLATGLDRMIALSVDSIGQVYYLARGSGDGGDQDNQSSAEGTLWRIRYTGSGAPVLSQQPIGVRVPVGEDVSFQVVASGQPPYTYQWLRDGVMLPADTLRVLKITGVALTDDQAEFRVVVSNRFGSDTSSTALLSVTTNARPIAQIDFPGNTSTYRAGDTLYFSGGAIDAEQGNLDVNSLSWTVEFYHDQHKHPVTELSGTDQGSVVLPTVGEVSSNVFYRITLSAIDTGLLTSSTYVDIYPELTTLELNSEPPGLSLNADGLARQAPFDVTSVVGLERTLRAPPAQQIGKDVYAFEHWEYAGAPADTSTVLTLRAPALAASYTAHYELLPRSTGTGLLAEYFSGGYDTLGRVRKLVRIDSLVDFDWGWASPGPGVPEDDWSVRWSGDVEAVVSGTYQFTVGSGDGARLWIDGQLLIDNWNWQDLAYRTASIELTAGKRVPIQLETFDAILSASTSLVWDHPNLPEGVVPTTSLYPTDTLRVPPMVAGNGVRLRVPHLTSAADVQVFVTNLPLDATATLSIFDASGRQVGGRLAIRDVQDAAAYRFEDVRLQSGIYVMQLSSSIGNAVTKFMVTP